MNNTLIIGIVVVVLAIGGYWVWSQNNPSSQTPEQVQNEQDNNALDDQITQPTEQGAPVGRIAGSLSYPSEGIPENMQVCAEAVNMSELYCTDAQISGNQYTYGKGYELTVPTGKYRVFATLAQNPKDPNIKRAYYNEFVRCGLTVECKETKDIAPIVVTVAEGEIVNNINPWDWYNN